MFLKRIDTDTGATNTLTDCLSEKIDGDYKQKIGQKEQMEANHQKWYYDEIFDVRASTW